MQALRVMMGDGEQRRRMSVLPCSTRPAVRPPGMPRMQRSTRQRSFVVVVVELLEHLLNLVELVLGLVDDLLELLQSIFLLDVFCACLVLQLAVVLDLFARVLYFGKAEGRRRALQEVAKLAECLEVLLLATRESAVYPSRKLENAQIGVHLGKGALGLSEEVIDDALAELAVDLVLVHLEDLLEGRGVDGVFCAGNRHDALAAVHALYRLELGSKRVCACSA